MTFSKRQFAAIYKMGQAMVLADGTINEQETAIVGGELIKFGVTPSDLEELIADSESMEFSKAVETKTLCFFFFSHYYGCRWGH